MSDEARLKARLQKLVQQGKSVSADELAALIGPPKKCGRPKHLRILGIKPDNSIHEKIEVGRRCCELVESGKSRQQAYRAVRREIRIWRSESYFDKCARIYREHRESWEAMRRLRQETHDWLRNNSAHSIAAFFDEERQRQFKMVVKSLNAACRVASTLYEKSDGITE